jgi:hypothetical protein
MTFMNNCRAAFQFAGISGRPRRKSSRGRITLYAGPTLTKAAVDIFAFLDPFALQWR